MKPRIVKKEGFKALGLKWQGTFNEASQGGIQKLFLDLREVSDGIEYRTEPGIVKGLSYHNLTGGFTYYLCQEVREIEEIRYGLEIIEVPAYTYAVLEHEGPEILASYDVLYNWIEEKGYRLNQQILQHLEEYPADHVPNQDDPKLIIHIPVSI